MDTKIKITLKKNKLLSTYVGDYHHFDELADILLNKTLLNVGTRTYRLCEIEFYYKGNGHEDHYTHCSDEQRLKGKLYFHKYKTGVYKSGTYKGLDITLSPDNIAYFGILIRSIQDQTTHEFIEGPCRSVNAILGQFGFQTVNDFVAGKKVPLDIYDTTYQLYLIDTPSLKHESIYHGPRIGLSDKYPEYQNLNYRYATLINNIKKKRNTLTQIAQKIEKNM